jgi:hypothetical protein
VETPPVFYLPKLSLRAQTDFFAYLFCDFNFCPEFPDQSDAGL